MDVMSKPIGVDLQVKVHAMYMYCGTALTWTSIYGTPISEHVGHAKAKQPL